MNKVMDVMGESESIFDARLKESVKGKGEIVPLTLPLDTFPYASEEARCDECDECDGIFQKSSKSKITVESKVSCNTEDEQQEEKKVILGKVLNMPSRPSQKGTQQYIEQGVTNNSEPSRPIKPAIKVGDRVMIEDAPSYWSWASPFTVQSIDGEVARLEMIDEMVEIKRLSLS